MKYIVHKTSDYTVMSNTHFKEKEMTLRAKGLLSLMLSLPDDWDYSIAGLCTLSKDGKDSVMNALLELEEFGYLVRTQETNDKGQFIGFNYDVYEVPYPEKPYPEKPYPEKPYPEKPYPEKPYPEKPNTEKPNTEKPNTEKPNTEKPQQLNTNISNNNLINNINNKILNNKNIYAPVVEYLNEKAGTKYKPSNKVTQRHINARVAEGYTLDDFKTVIDKKVTEWKGTAMEQYLRPETLFGSKFENYLNATIQPRNGQKVTINGEEYIYNNGNYYIPNGTGIAVDPYADNDLPY